MKAVVFCVAALYVAAIVHFGLTPFVHLFGVHPDILLTCAIALGLCLSRPGGAAVGFVAGVLTGALVGANLAHYVVSFTLAGFVAAWTRSLRIESTAPAVAFTVAGCSIVAGLAFLLTAAPRGIAEYLGDTIVSALYNGVLAIPLYALFRRVLNPTVR